MKRLFFLILLLFCATSAKAQILGQRVIYTTLNPPVVCVPGKLYTNSALVAKKVWLGAADNTCVQVSSAGGSVTANPTVGVIPYLSAANTYSDSPLSRTNATTVSTTNLSATAIGMGVTAPANGIRIQQVFVTALGLLRLDETTGTGTASTAYLSFGDSAGTRTGLFGFGRYAGAADGNFYEANENTGGFIFRNSTLPIFTFDNTGNVKMPPGNTLGWAVTNGDPLGVLDTNINRASAGVVNVGTSSANASGTLKAAVLAGTTQVGIYNFNQAAQSQVTVSGTEYYLTNSNLNMPAVYTTAIAAGTTMHWRIALTKTAAGTGTFQILLKKGTNGTIADTSIVTQTIGTQTAAADNMEADISLTWTSATAAYWTIVPHQSAASATGFGLVYPATAAQFSGTISGQTTTTASDKYGLSVIFTTGTPTFVVNLVRAQAFGVN